MYKLIAFDLDDTLCPQGCPMLPENVALLHEIADSGLQIALCSGKPAYYLCGFMRQVGLTDVLLIGENGATIQYGVELPPKRFEVLPYSDAARRSIALLRTAILEKLPTVFFQPNVVGLTPFPRSPAEFSLIDALIEQNRELLTDIDIYHQPESIDIVPKGISKADGLKKAAEMLGVEAAEVIAVGDSVNDYPMFAYAALALGVKVRDPSKVDRDFPDASAMLRAVLREYCSH